MSSKRKRDDESGDAPPLQRMSSQGHAPARLESKKTTNACLTCRKQKIRCDMPNDASPCVRCHRRGFECVIHNPSRAGYVDGRQLDLVKADLTSIFSTLKGVCDHLGLAPPVDLNSVERVANDAYHWTGELNGDLDSDAACGLSPPGSPSAANAPIDTFLGAGKPESNAETTSPQRSRRRINEHADIVSKGIIALATAQELVDQYLSRLDFFLYALCNQYKDFEAVRAASPTLLAAICTVAAFHHPKHRTLFDACNREYRHLVSIALFEKKDAEHIRALCIGSFWLPNASRILSSEAIRRAADARLHRHFSAPSSMLSNGYHAPDTTLANDVDRDCVRLWYLLFICDQHLSILHNRDSVMRRDLEILEGRDDFLLSSGATNQDVRLISQVSLLAIMGQIRDVFGSEQLKPVAKSLGVQFTHFSRELDLWYSKFSVMFEPDNNIGEFPLAGLQLHFQFSKLYLGHNLFRGLKGDPIPPHFTLAASTAHTAATTIFTMLLNNSALRDNILGVPHYFHIMISFAAHFLLEICVKHREQLNIAVEEDLELVRAVLAHLTRISVVPQHPIARVATALMRKLSECTTMLGIEPMLSGSPFGTLEGSYAAARDFGTNMITGQIQLEGSFDMASEPLFEGDFTFADFRNYDFQDPNFQFFT